MSETKETFNVGDRVVKDKRYSSTEYCKFGGTEPEVPLGTPGIVVEVRGEDKFRVLFDSGIEWSIHSSELIFEKGYKRPSLSDVKYMVYGTGCNNRSNLSSNEDELKEGMIKASNDSNWTGDIIGYKLIPIYKLETKKVFFNFLTKKQINKMKGGKNAKKESKKIR